MTSQTNGPNESAAQSAEKLDVALDQYERRLGIPPLTGDDGVAAEASRLLDLPPAQLQAMSAVQCAEAAYVLGQYAHRLQNAANREGSRVRWANESINKVIGRTVVNYKGYSYEERRTQAVADNDHASKLDEVRVRSQLRLDRVSYMASRADTLVKVLLAIKNAKQGNHRE